MSKQDLNYGASPNDGTGDTGRGGAIKIKANFDELYQFLGGDALALPATRIPYGDGSGFHTSSANLTYSETAGLAAGGTAGKALTLTAGTATTDLNALSITQTMNGGAGVNHTGSKWTFTEGASGTGSGTLLLDILYGTSGAEASVFSVNKIGTIQAPVGSLIVGGGIALGATQYFGWTTRSYVISPSDGVIRLSNNAETDFGRLQFGGTTSSFPAIKRSSATLQARLADDSGDAVFSAASYIGEVYTLQSTAANFNPADAGTYYQGMSGATPSTTAAVHVVPIPVAGTITNIRLEIAVAGTLGSSETSTVSLRLNNTTDTTITAAGAYTAARQAYSANVSITVAAGDYFQIKIAAPTWATTNPTAVVHSAVVTVRTT